MVTAAKNQTLWQCRARETAPVLVPGPGFPCQKHLGQEQRRAGVNHGAGVGWDLRQSQQPAWRPCSRKDGQRRSWGQWGNRGGEAPDNRRRLGSRKEGPECACGPKWKAVQEGGRWQGASEDWRAGSEDEEGQTPSRVRSRLNVDDAKAAEAKDDSMKICRARLGRLRAAYLSAQWRTSRHGIQKEDSQHSGVLT